MMKYFVIAFALISYLNLHTQPIDITKKPEPLREKEFVFPDYTETTLSNGMKVFIIEDHEQPTIAFNMLIPGGSSMDGDKPGLAELTARMLTKGADKLKALDIAKKLDGIGARITANSRADYISVYAQSLKKRLDILLDIYTKVILKPSFDEDEFDKLKKQYISELAYEKSQPRSIVSAMTKIALFGKEHPYSGKPNEEFVNKISTDDLKNYYKKYFIPNNVNLAIIGDITVDEAKKELDKYFKKWEKGKVPEIVIPAPKPMPIGIYFISRPGSVQSSISVSTITTSFTNPDYEYTDLAAAVLGSGFGGRLMRELREKHSFTYGSYGIQTTMKYFNRFGCGADVRNIVTDSSIAVILGQLKLLGTVAVPDSELYRIKKHERGNYLMSFEQPEFIASLIQESYFQGIHISKVKSYPQRLMSIAPFDIKRVAQEYMLPNRAYIVVVGNPEIKSKLAQFGNVFEYNADCEPVTGTQASLKPSSLDAEELIEKYIKAIGGKNAIDTIKTLVKTGVTEMTYQANPMPPGKIISSHKAPGNMHQIVEIGGMKHEYWVRNDSAWFDDLGNLQSFEGNDLDNMLQEARIFPVADLLSMGYTCDVKGVQNGNTILAAKSKSGTETTYYFNKDHLLIMKETIAEGGYGPMQVSDTYEDYQLIGGVRLPQKITSINPMFTLKVEYEYEVNNEISDDEFFPAKRK